MICATMLSFLANNPARRHTAHMNPLTLDAGRSSLHFFPPSSDPHAYQVRLTLPPQATENDVRAGRALSKLNTSIAPPYHWHANQVENFHVISGTMYMRENGRDIILRAGGKIRAPAQTYHTFKNASGEQPLVFELYYEPHHWEGSESFFSKFQAAQ